MKTVWTIIEGTGLVLVILGIACAGSPSELVPAAMIASGAVMIGVSAGMEGKWAEK